ncbi:MAG: TRAP transporter substrate-binding protein [Burkholderiales bacterium]
MKKALILILSLVFVFGMVSCGAPPASPSAPAETSQVPVAESPSQAPVAESPSLEPVEPVNIILGHFGAPNEPVSKAAETFKAKLEELSGGSMTVEIHGASELGNAPEMAEQTRIGAIQACLVSQGTLDKFDPRYALVTAPYVYSGYAHAYAVVDGPFAEWVGDGVLESKGLHNVGPWDYGFRNLTNSVREVKVLADVKGLRIRTPQEVQKVACFEALGATVQQVAFSELISALKQGTVDGQENPISTIYNNSMWEANQKYLSLTRHTWEAVNLTVCNSWWNGLTDEQKKFIEEAGAVARDQMRDEVQSSEQNYIQKLKDEGVAVTEVDLAVFKEAMEPAWARVAEYEGSTEDMDKFLKMVEDAKP